MSQQRRRAEQVQAAYVVNVETKPDRLAEKRRALGQKPDGSSPSSTSAKRPKRAKRAKA